jgi:hypothetical protein
MHRIESKRVQLPSVRTIFIAAKPEINKYRNKSSNCRRFVGTPSGAACRGRCRHRPHEATRCDNLKYTRAKGILLITRIDLIIYNFLV